MARKLLLIDDDADLAALIGDFLKAQGYEMIWADRPSVGLERLIERPDLILLDVMLPERDGFEVCRDLRASGNTVPILMLTARGDDLDRIRGLNLGADDYLRQIGLGQASFIAKEVEATIERDGPSRATLARLQGTIGAKLHFVPWRKTALYPAALHDDPVVSLPTGRRGIRAWRYWVRIDLAGQPVGAMSADLRPPPRMRMASSPFVAAGVMMFVVALVIIPPLFFWVMGPLRRMVAVAQRLGEGDLETSVRFDRRDEFGNLQKAFESLRVHILQMLHQRDRLLTDILHELRGPLSRLAIALPLARMGLETGGSAKYLDQAERDM